MSLRQWHMCHYVSKIEDQCSQNIKQVAKETFENYGTMKTIAKAYLSNTECSVKEAVYHNLSELKLSRIFSTVYFVNTNLPE